jgi:hypothetical protein
MPAGPLHRPLPRILLPLTLLVLLLAEVPSAGVRPARAGGPPPGQVVPQVAAAYGAAATGFPGTLAVAISRVEMPASGLSARGAEARTARLRTAAAGNGTVSTRPFPSASMVKLFVAEELLHRARTGVLVLSPDDRDLLGRMIRSSDDPAASLLWVRHGGGGMVTAVARRYGLTGTAPPVVPGRWGQTTTTARDLASFLARVPVIAHPDDAATLLGWMREATPLAADGFDQRFGLFGALPGQPPVKQGWMCCAGGRRHLHSVAVVRTRVVVLLSETGGDVGWEAARGALTAAARAVPTPAQR